MLRKIFMLLIDILLAAAIVLGTWVYYFKISHSYGYTVSSAVVTATTVSTLRNTADAEAIREKFSDKFTDTVVSAENTYTDSNLAVYLSSNSYDSGKLDKTGDGKHTKYGSKIAYVVADIYTTDVSHIQTLFAQDTYGVGYDELIGDMSDRVKAVLGINGDSYSNNRHCNNGTIIRNGTLYRSAATDMETCVLFRDGTMKIYQPSEVDAQQLIQDGAWQSWIFGPSLLDENGHAKTDFLTWSYIRESHPRTAIGYYEPGHYCFVIVDGRQTGYSRGMFLSELSQLFANLGCQAAYNLDGGFSSSMVFQGKTVSKPYKPSRKISDGIFLK